MKYWHQHKDHEKAGVRKILEEYVEEKIPGFAVHQKSSSRVMRFLGSVLFFVPTFMTSFVTTLYPKIYVPDLSRWKSNHTGTLKTLSHEYVHLSDRKRLGFLFNLIYLSPQVFALLALLSFYNLWFLFALFLLLPLPSIGRTWAEVRGYRMTMAVHFWLTSNKYNIEYLTKHFIGSNYYWMWPFKSHIKNILEKEYKKIQNNDLAPELAEVREVLTKAGVICYDASRR